MKYNYSPDDSTNKFKTNESWPEDDKWHLYSRDFAHSYTKNKIRSTINLNAGRLLLNIGSGGYSYGLEEYEMIHQDIVEENIKNKKKYIVGTAEQIDVESNSIDACICIGSVINYCDPIKVIQECYRVLKKDGVLILDFETTHNYELIFTSQFNQCACLVETFYRGEKEVFWAYKYKYIRVLLDSFSFTILEKVPYHLMSSLVYRLTKNENKAAWYTKYDKCMRVIPLLNNLSSAVLLTAKKL